MNGRSTNGGHQRKSHCWRGHTLDDAYVSRDGVRSCRSCKLADERRRYARKKAAA
jgi:hypothetical protein